MWEASIILQGSRMPTDALRASGLAKPIKILHSDSPIRFPKISNYQDPKNFLSVSENRTSLHSTLLITLSR